MIVEKINITKTSVKRTFSLIMALLMIITSLSVSAFAVDTSGKNFDYYIEDGEVTILDNYCSDNESITIPEKIEGYPVTIIAEKAFSECKASEITIPETVVQICYSAFYGCKNLKNITIPDSVTSLGDSAFNNCSGLTSVTISNNIKEIGRDTFINCSGLTSVTIPDSVTKIGDYAFNNCIGLTSVTIPDSVTSIGNYIFYRCTGLTSVIIPNSVTSIGYKAFSYCTGLTSITIPDSVTSIDYRAFDGCSGLTNITIPDSVTNIGNYAFSDCTRLINITVDGNNPNYSSDEYGVLFNKDKTTLIQYPVGNERTEYIIPNSVTSIGNCAFEACIGLSSITIPNSVTSIGYYAFSDCTGLTSVIIPNCVTSIGYSAFYDCTGLTSITIPDSVTSIGDYAFYGCSELNHIKLGNGIKSIPSKMFSGTGCYNNEENWVNKVLYIDSCLIAAKTDISDECSIKEGTRIIADRAFYNCRNLTSVTIPGSVETMGDYAFYNCSSLTSISIPGSVKYIDSYSFSGCSSLSSATLENGIVGIGDSAFRTCINLVSISIPDSVEEIGTYAFYGCLNLKTISIGSGIKSIGKYAFTETGYYINKKDNWVNNVLYIDNYLIKATSVSGEYMVKDGTTIISDDAFSGCSSLTSITIPDSVKSIGNSAFEYCAKLTGVTIGSSVTSIGNSAFKDCTGLTSVTIGNSVTSIGESAFKNCAGLTSVTIPDSVTSIGQYAFEDCTGLTSIKIPDSVTSIGGGVFEDCTRLTSITVDENNQYYSSDEGCALFSKDKTQLIQYPVGNPRTTFTIPDSVTSIGVQAFRGCSRLTSVTIPDSVTSIGISAFNGCTELTGVTIPDSVTSIDWYAFEDCTGLTSVTIGNGVTSIGDGAFKGCTGLTSITVDGNNPNYSSDEYGVLFNKDKTTLIQYPVGNERTEYIIPNSVTSIGDYAFSGCTGLTNVRIPNSVIYIDNGAFSECTSLVVDNLPRRLIAIGYGAFENCEGLVSIMIPGKVTYIASDAFSNCNNLERFFVDESNKYYSSDNFGVLFNKDKTELIIYPVGNARTSYTVPETVETIKSDSFYNCKNLVSITIPKSVRSIYSYAFYSCDNLNTVYYTGSPSKWSKIWIAYGNGSLENATIIYAEEDSESGETVEIKKETVSDETTDVSVEYISNFHEGEVGLEVERTFDGKAFDVISTQLDINSNEIYDIKMTIDGVVTQPNGKVKVKIPIPAGYDPAKTFVYHVNANTGTVENMNAVVEGNYLVFETDHFSYYAVVEVKDAAPDEPAEQSYKITWNIDGKITEQKYKAGDVITAPQNPIKSGYRFVGWSPAVPATMPSYDLTFTAVFEKLSSPAEDGLTVSIRTPSTTSVDYGDSIILHLDIDRPLPDGAYIEWSESNGNFDMSVSADGLTCKILPKSSGKTVFTATVYDKDGNVISSDTQEMTAKAGLWQKIVAFFKKIFGLTKTIPEAFKGIL